MIRVLGDRVLVALPPKQEVQEESTGYTYQEQKTASGLILAKPTDAFDVVAATRGIVVQVGEKKGTVDLDDVRAEVNELFLSEPADRDLLMPMKDYIDRALTTLGPAPFDVSVGDMVLFPPSAGEVITDGGLDYVILREDDLLGVVQPLQKDAA